MRKHILTLATAALLLLVASACDRGSPPETAEPEPTTSESPTTAGSPTATSEPVSADDYDPGRFEDSANVDHGWYPLQPGTRLEYVGSSVEDGERLNHAVDIIVTDLTKTIDGVPNVVVWERDYTEGELVETELALFAQDTDGHVWHMGEYPEEYEEGELVATPAWVHGLAGATAGITIPAEPRTGTPDYAQGFAPPPIAWVDRGVVHKTGQRICVPAGCFDDVVVIAEFEPNIPHAFQDKYYAPGVGVVGVGWRGKNDESKEELELVRSSTLGSDELARVRAEALELEERAYRISKRVWGRTPRAE